MSVDRIGPEGNSHGQRVDRLGVLTDRRLRDSEAEIRGVELRGQPDSLGEFGDCFARLTELLIRRAQLKMCARIVGAEPLGARERIERRHVIVQLLVGQAQIEKRGCEIGAQLRGSLEAVERLLRPSEVCEREAKAEVRRRQVWLERSRLAKRGDCRLVLTAVEAVPPSLEVRICRIGRGLADSTEGSVTRLTRGHARCGVQRHRRREADNDSRCQKRTT